jgi:CrcB protein
MTLALAAVAGGIGAFARWWLQGYVQRRLATTRPWGTAVVNVSGALALGLITGLGFHGELAPAAMKIIGPGLLGGYTTFSTWMFETVNLAGAGGRGRLRAATMNLVIPLLAGLAAVLLGEWAGGRF